MPDKETKALIKTAVDMTVLNSEIQMNIHECKDHGDKQACDARKKN